MSALENQQELKFAGEQGFFDKSKVIRYCIMLMLAISLFFFLHFREIQVESLELNTIAPSYIVSQVSFDFPDEEATLILRQDALRDVGKIYALSHRDVAQKRIEFENFILYNQSSQDLGAGSVFNSLYEATEVMERALSELRFTDALMAVPPLLFALVLAALAVLLLAGLVVFWRLMPAYTTTGRQVQDHIDGLREYLGIAERGDLARMKTPEATPAEFARMLPYALALDVEKTWADRFAAVLGTAAVAAAVAQYYQHDAGSNSTGPGSIDDLTRSLDAFSGAVSAASTPPASSSGSSSDAGGGSSGGGRARG